MDAGELGLKSAEQLGRERSGGAHDGLELEAGEVELGDGGLVHHVGDDGRDDGREGDLVLDKRGEEGPEVVAAHDDDGALAAQRGAADAGDAVDVEEGHEPQHGHLSHHLRRHREQRRAEVGHKVAVRQHDALGHASRARGEWQRAQVALPDHQRPLPGAARSVRRVEELVPVYGSFNGLFVHRDHRYL